ncbi:MAG: lipopolysaccharide transport periplasmic protein LptA [Candidatus Rokubacteria bacterium]|nr:lipopolysaccharide transport periplasmic protein LptA [Candidatus Rokubacteria bacterium]
MASAKRTAFVAFLAVALAAALADAQPAAKPRKPGTTGEPKAERQPAKARAADAPALKPEEDQKNQPVVVDADQMESLKKEGLVIFTGNVVARQNNSIQYADRMEVYLDERGERVLRTVSTGNVRVITKDCRIGTARRGEYDDLEQRVVLTGNARVWQDDNVVTGERITIYLAEERSIVQGGKQERVRAVFSSKSDDRRQGTKAAGPAACR